MTDEQTPRSGAEVKGQARKPAPAGTGAKPDETRAITRRDFEAVIRRAAELSANEAEEGAEETLSEDEVVRIAAELGLPMHNVRRALYELPETEGAAATADSWFGPTMLTATRVVPAHADVMRRRLEDYLTTREYLQVVRHREGRMVLMPAEDAISQVARGLLRPSRRFHLARARRVVMGVRPLDDTKAHVQIVTDMGDQRKTAVRTGAFFGITGGLVAGGVGAALASTIGLPPIAESAVQIAAFATGFGGTLAGAIAATRAAFRSKLRAARVELEGLLDRAETSDRLDPPAAPWQRRLQKRFLGN
ncbi:MAG: hypothetical protein ACREL7_19090 [Longimicrobiales bacterium]